MYKNMIMRHVLYVHEFWIEIRPLLTPIFIVAYIELIPGFYNNIAHLHGYKHTDSGHVYASFPA
jgi:hypothetical protein